MKQHQQEREIGTASKFIKLRWRFLYSLINNISIEDHYPTRNLLQHSERSCYNRPE